MPEPKADHEIALRVLWRDIAEKGIEHGVDWPRIVRTLFADLDEVTAERDAARLALKACADVRAERAEGAR